MKTGEKPVALYISSVTGVGLGIEFVVYLLNPLSMPNLVDMASGVFGLSLTVIGIVCHWSMGPRKPSWLRMVMGVVGLGVACATLAFAYLQWSYIAGAAAALCWILSAREMYKAFDPFENLEN
jgi:hypothetical protein